MKRIILFSFILGCSSETPKPQEPIKKEEVKIAEPVPFVRAPIKHCEITKATKIRDCVLYELICEDGSTDMVMLCSIQPIGVITNPPRPVVE